MIRRAVDVVAAVLGLAVLAPLFLGVAAVVRLDSPGPALYRGPRVGRGGRVFRMWKFRTMRADADRVGPRITGRGDPRITRVGAFLRATKIDELPQLVNLLLGDLTLVGPRAEVPDIVARYTPEQRRSLDHTPGITGPGQIHYTVDGEDRLPEGSDPAEFYVRHLLGPKLEMDLAYLRTRTWRSDIVVLARTVRVVAGALVGSSRAARPEPG